MKTKKFRILIAGGLTLFFIGGIYLQKVFTLPGHLPKLENSMSRVIIDRHGQPLQIPLTTAGDRALFLPIEKIPPSIQQVFIVAEDKRFYIHNGVDWLAFGRAVWQTIKNFRFVSGASTITMQTVRIHWPELTGPFNKPAQMAQAWRIERNHSKGEILAHYLNLVPFAYQVAGVSQGCRYFFDKTCDRLSLAESASLAVLPRNPAIYTRDHDALLKARNHLIRQLVKEQPQDSIAVKQALAEKIKLNSQLPERFAEHFGDRVFRETRATSAAEIKTTLDRSIQVLAQNILRQQVNRNKGLGDSGAILVVDNKNAEVLAYVGGPDFFNKQSGMMDATRALRSPGSAIKPFVYAYALEQKWTLSSLLPDVPIQLKVKGGIFSPNNYGGSFSGPRQIRLALANSHNIPALYLTSKLGESSVLTLLRHAGFNSLDKPGEHYGVGLVLGNGEVSLWELTQAYSMLARGGVLKPLHYYPSSPNEEHSTGSRVLSKESSYLIADVLSDPKARSEEFGRGGPLEFEYRVAVKTGTSSDFRDHWTAGFTRDFTVGVWRGNADGSPLRSKVPAARGSGPIFHQLMDYLHKKKTPRWFSQPEKIVSQTVCSLSGDLPGPHCNTTRDELFVSGNGPKRKCSMHRAMEIANCGGKPKTIQYVDLPQKYRAWAEAEGLPTLQKQLQSVCGFAESQIGLVLSKDEPYILEPLPNSILAIDPTMPREHQQLRIAFENTNQKNKVMLFINGKPYEEVTGKTEVLWQLTQGSHRFELKSKNKTYGNGTRISVF